MNKYRLKKYKWLKWMYTSKKIRWFSFEWISIIYDKIYSYLNLSIKLSFYMLFILQIIPKIEVFIVNVRSLNRIDKNSIWLVRFWGESFMADLFILGLNRFSLYGFKFQRSFCLGLGFSIYVFYIIIPIMLLVLSYFQL